MEGGSREAWKGKGGEGSLCNNITVPRSIEGGGKTGLWLKCGHILKMMKFCESGRSYFN